MEKKEERKATKYFILSLRNPYWLRTYYAKLACEQLLEKRWRWGGGEDGISIFKAVTVWLGGTFDLNEGHIPNLSCLAGIRSFPMPLIWRQRLPRARVAGPPSVLQRISDLREQGERTMALESAMGSHLTPSSWVREALFSLQVFQMRSLSLGRYGKCKTRLTVPPSSWGGCKGVIR